MEYKFERFTAIEEKGNQEISINFYPKAYSFLFSRSFVEKEGLGKYERVLFFFDEKNCKIAFNFTNDKEHSFSLQKRHMGHRQVCARSFVGKYKLGQEDERIQKRVPEKIQDKEFGTLYVIQL